MGSSLAADLRDELSKLVEPLAAAGRTPEGWPLVLALVGQSADAADDPQLRAALDHLAAAATDLIGLGDADLGGWEGIARILQAAGDTIGAVRGVEAAVQDPALASRLEDLGAELTGQLIAVYLRAYHPRVLWVASLLTVVDPLEEAEVERAVLDGGTLVRGAWARDTLHLDRVAKLLQDPWPLLREAYLPNDLATASDAHAAAERLFPLLRAVAHGIGLAASSELVATAPPAAPSGDGLGAGSLSHFSGDPDPAPEELTPALAADLTELHRSLLPRLYLTVPQLDAAGAVAGARVALAVVASSPDYPGGVAGHVVELAGTLAWTETRGALQITVSSEGEVPAFVIGPGGIDLAPAGALAGATVRLAVDRPAARSGPQFVLGSDTGTRLELGALRLDGLLQLRPSGRSAELTAAASSGLLVIAGGDADGFLQSVLPADGLRTPFDFGIGVSTTSGVFFKGAAGLEATLPVHADVLGALRLDAIHLALRAADDGLSAEISAGATVTLGPVAASVERIGVDALLGFPPDGGNLGPAELSLGFKPPSGLGLVVDAGPVSGGGFLFYDPVGEQYAGALQLAFSGIALKAVGVLTTRLPGGAAGFSLLVIVSAEFTPVQLGLGFTLNGVGGLLGVNRVAAVEPLRAGLRAGTLGAILFPADPVAHAQQLVATISTVFPPAPGRYVFGPTARIGWGTPTLVTIDIALVLELPAPVRLIVLGRLRALLPDEQAAVVRLQMDVLGVIDFDRREAAVDAVLVDSRLASFALTGAMAMRLSWGSGASFLLAVGGFNPRFVPPAGFPQLDRVAVALASGDNPRLRLESYLALTSNTLQFGARLDLSVGAGGFTVVGFLSFDALMEQEPLSFVVDIAGSLAVKAGSHTLFSVTLRLTLSGPEPWHARGRASFSILFFDVTVRFEVTIGDSGPPALPRTVEVAPLLLAALADARSWSAQLPAGGDALVTLRALPPTADILAHAHGTLQVRQRLVPLEHTLERFGGDVPAGARLFRIATATLAGDPVATEPLDDLFAPGQFSSLSDDAKLSQPSFASMRSGARIGEHDVACGTPLPVAVDFEQVTVPARAAAA